MKIGIDISPIIYESGVSWYTWHLVKNLLRVDKSNEYLLFGGSLRRTNDLLDKIQKLRGKFKISFYPIPPTVADFLWNKLHLLNIESVVGSLDVFHSSDWSQPPSNAFKVTTIHDLSPITYPGLTDEKVIKNTQRRLKWIVKEVDRIIVPSQSTKRDLLHYGVKEAKVKVISEASNVDGPASQVKVDSFKRKYAIVGEYLLGVGVSPRKNTKRLIAAYRKVLNILLPKKKINMVFVGEKWLEISDTHNIIFTGHISNEELQAAYSGAKVLVYASICEGFGIPILDAYACGCPVVTSNISSMPEVASGAAVLVNPFDVDSIAKGLLKAMQNCEDLVKRGRSVNKRFSWEEVARQTLDVYNEAHEL